MERMRGRRARRTRRSGFTLVELLIVIIIIGILAGAMLLLSGGGQDRAEATRIISDLRTLAGAAQMFFTDHPDEVRLPMTAMPPNDIAKLEPYVDRALEVNDFATFDPSKKGYFFIRTFVGAAYVGYAVVPGTPDTGISLSGPAKVLAGEREDVGLLGSSSLSMEIFTNPDFRLPKYNGGAMVLMKAR